MPVELITQTYHQALGSAHANSVSHEPWSAPEKRTKDNCIGHDTGEDGTESEFKYPIYTSDGKLSVKGVGIALAYAEKNAPNLVPALKAISTAIKSHTEMSAINFILPRGLLSAVDGEPKKVGNQPASYFWKDLICSGNWIQPRTKEPIPVDRDRIKHWADVGNDMLANGITIPVNRDHGHFSGDTIGNVVEFKADGDKLLGKLQMIGDDAATLLSRNDVSVGILPQNMLDGSRKTWKDIIYHVAVTQFPVVPGLDQPIAASAMAGAPNFYVPMGQTVGANMDSIPCSAECLSALKGHGHLGLSGVPDSGVMGKIAEFHAKHAQHLSAIRRDVPGMDGASDGDEMPRLAQHLSTMKAVREKLYPSQMAAHLSAIEKDTILLSRVDELSNAAKGMEQKDQTIRTLEGQITKMSSKVIGDIDPTAATFLSALVDTQVKGMIEKGVLQPHVGKALQKLVVDGDKVNSLLCSAAANPFGTRPVILDILEIIAGNGPSPATLDPKGQNLGYMAPQTKLDDNEATKKLQGVLTGKTA